MKEKKINKLYKNKDWLYEQYVVLKKSINEIADFIGVDHTTISYWLKKFNIPIRSLSEAMKIVMNKSEVRKKISDFNKGKKISEEHKRKLSEVHKGKKISEEHKKRISEKLKGRYVGEDSPHWKGNNVSYGNTHDWVRNNKLKPEFCEICGKLKELQLSNKTGKLIRDINNFQYVCVSCHRKYDIKNKIIHEGI